MNKEFQVICRKHYGDLLLSVTHGGSQWDSIIIYDPDVEIPLIIAELQHCLDKSLEEIECPKRG